MPGHEKTERVEKTRSTDGTPIAFERTGQGPPVVIVVGAFNDRMTGHPLAQFLAPRFTVFTYDRRGRGDSGDADRYAIEREIEDLEAVIQSAGGSAPVFGYSSGAVLALKAAASGAPITRVALYDTPPPQEAEHVVELSRLVAAGRRGEAVEYFQRRLVGIPEDVIAKLRHAPFRPALEAAAHTLVYDATLVSSRPSVRELSAEIRQPVLAMAGGAGAPVMRDIADTLGRSLPNGRSLFVEGAAHDLAPAALGPVVERFLASAKETG